MDLTQLLNYPVISRISINMLLNSEPEYTRPYTPLFTVSDSPSSAPTYSSGPVTKRRRLNVGEYSPVCVQACPPSTVIENLTNFPISPPCFSNSSTEEESNQLARSRIVGLRHRGNEIIRKEQLELDIAAYKRENDTLIRRIEEEEANLRRSPIFQSTSILNGVAETAEDTLIISESSSQILGTGSSGISGESAILLLELIALRRNLVQFREYPSSSPNSVLNCPDPMEITQAINCRIWNSKFIRIHALWSQQEPGSKFNMAEDKEESIKYCVRCRKVRKAGNGHPRSNCDDGFRVNSIIPYREKSNSMLYITFRK